MTGPICPGLVPGWICCATLQMVLTNGTNVDADEDGTLIRCPSVATSVSFSDDDVVDDDWDKSASLFTNNKTDAAIHRCPAQPQNDVTMSCAVLAM